MSMPRMGFFTDTSVCIGCKACEVACKEWNAIPADNSAGLSGLSFDNTGELSANSWRHVASSNRPVTTARGG
jgi:formate dehydrogenase iron-sulfur subunit